MGSPGRDRLLRHTYIHQPKFIHRERRGRCGKGKRLQTNYAREQEFGAVRSYRAARERCSKRRHCQRFPIVNLSSLLLRTLMQGSDLRPVVTMKLQTKAPWLPFRGIRVIDISSGLINFTGCWVCGIKTGIFFFNYS